MMIQLDLDRTAEMNLLLSLGKLNLGKLNLGESSLGELREFFILLPDECHNNTIAVASLDETMTCSSRDPHLSKRSFAVSSLISMSELDTAHYLLLFGGE